VGELDYDKLPPLLLLKYKNSMKDAVADLGMPDQVRKVFSGFQGYLYQG
jgi:type I restriction enzyme R subunit